MSAIFKGRHHGLDLLIEKSVGDGAQRPLELRHLIKVTATPS